MGSTGSEPWMVKQKLKFPHHGILHSSVGLDDMTDEACIAPWTVERMTIMVNARPRLLGCNGGD
jgi:hypothetical protein